MAKVDANRIVKNDGPRDYIVVIRGDTLSEIAEAYFGDWTKFEQLATINKLANPNIITEGQKIYLEADTSTSQPSPSNDVVEAVRPTVTIFGLLAENANKLAAAWTIPEHMRKDTENFEVEWKAYRAGITEWKDEDVMVDRQYSTYDLPNDGITSYIQFRVRPRPKKKEENGTKSDAFNPNLWTNWNDNTYYIVDKPDVPRRLSVELNDNRLTASVDDIDTADASIIEFKLVKNGNDTNASYEKVAVDSTGSASHVFNVDDNASYKVCCRGIKDDIPGEWSPYSSSVETRPGKLEFTEDTPRTIRIDADNKVSVKVQWGWSDKEGTGNIPSDMKYILAYTSQDSFYEGTDGTGTEITVDSTEFTVDKLENGTAYTFRVKAVNSDNQEGEWSDTKTLTLGSSPTVPTTWSSTTTVVTGERLSLYWVHNSTDGSPQQKATVTLEFKGVDNVAAIMHDVSVDADRLESPTIKVDDNDSNVVYYDVVSKNTDNSNANSTYALILDTENYSNGASITWTVSTSGISGAPSGLSMSREVYIYNRPTVSLSVKDVGDIEVGTAYYKVEYLKESDVYMETRETLDPLVVVDAEAVPGKNTDQNRQLYKITIDDADIYYCTHDNESLRSFPFLVNVEVGTNTEIQSPVEYHLSVSANHAYETIDNFGTPTNVLSGDVLYSEHFSADAIVDRLKLMKNISAEDVNLLNGQSYTVKCVIAMSSGITVSVSKELDISWGVERYLLNSEIGFNRDRCSVTIRPYCEIPNTVYYKVNYSYGKYVTDTSEKYSYIYGTVQPYFTTTTGDQVYYGTLADGTKTYYTIRAGATAVNNVLFGVYRREFDGTFTEIISGLDAAKNSSVTDPHPSLNFARYRITAKDKATGAISYTDIANYYIGETAIIIQWNEPYTSYAASENEIEVTNKSETFLRLPYNIDVTTSRDPDVSLIKYIGRKHPVSYYGTQVGEKASWTTTVPKSDTETLYTLQRLQAWSGDVYVREPYGTGYWANIKVSMSRAHLETVVPVTLDITRVEGGI